MVCGHRKEVRQWYIGQGWVHGAEGIAREGEHCSACIEAPSGRMRRCSSTGSGASSCADIAGPAGSSSGIFDDSAGNTCKPMRIANIGRFAFHAERRITSGACLATDPGSAGGQLAASHSGVCLVCACRQRVMAGCSIEACQQQVAAELCKSSPARHPRSGGSRQMHSRKSCCMCRN